MSAALAGTERAEYVLIEGAMPSRPVETMGVVLVDVAADRAYCRFRRDWDELFEETDLAEFFGEAARHLEFLAEEMGAKRFLDWLESDLSNAVRVTERDSTLVENWDRALSRLYARHVAARVLPFRTHLPLFSVYAAAGGWGENRDAGTDPENWVEVPADVHIQKDMFVAHVVGRSMEPRIHDGDLCLFRAGAALAGTRQGALVLVENSEDIGQRFTIKRYRSEKVETADGYRHARITLEPLNPDFHPWDLDAEEEANLKIRGIFVQVLQSAGS